MRSAHKQRHQDRRGAVLILTAIMMIVMIGMVAYSIDISYLSTVKTQLQRAADASALAAAAEMNKYGLTAARSTGVRIGELNQSSSAPVQIDNSDLVFGVWDLDARTFTPSASGSGGNAVEVTITQTPNLFFAKALGISSSTVQVKSVAIATPRDICFVVDLSGSMNDDTDTCWCTTAINNKLGSTVGNSIAQNVYNDFNLGQYPGNNPYMGASIGATSFSSTTTKLTNNNSVGSAYKITSSDSTSTKKSKTYNYIIEQEICNHAALRNAKPLPAASSSNSFWRAYIDYVGSSITSYNNPNSANYPGVSGATSWKNKIGPATYVQFLMDNGRDEKVAGDYTPLSAQSGDCPWHTEVTDGGTFSFPPREMPTHAARRSVIAALATIQNLNSLNPSAQQRDWVSIVTFDKSNPAPVVAQALTYDYLQAMQTCTKFQAVSDVGASTATEYGLITAQDHLKPTSEGGNGRLFSDKVVVLLTDGQPNIVTSSSSTINNYRNSHPSDDWYGGSRNYAQEAPLMQTMMMQLEGWKTYPVGIGFGTDYDFMDRMARTGTTADDNGEAPRGSGDPSVYEQRLKEIFQDIISNAGVRLVQ